MFSRSGGKIAPETFLVAKTSTALYNVAGSGNNITNPSTGAVRLADGQLGIFAADHLGSVAPNVATDATPVVTEARNIYIAQGTEWSSNPGARPGARYPLWNRPYERSATIYGNNPVIATKQLYVEPTTSVWVIGQPDSTAGEIEALDSTEYSLRIAYRGARFDEFYNPEGTAFFAPNFVTPDYTTLGTAEPRDHLIQNLAWNINRNSKAMGINYTRFRGNEPVVALAIDSTGAAGDNIGGLGSGGTPIAAGDFIPVVTTAYGVRGITLTADQAASIKAAAVAASGDAIADVTWSILTIDLTTAGTVTGGVADIIMLVALDADLAWEDKVLPVKTRLQVGLTTGFDSTVVTNDEFSFASEGSGTGRVWDRLYRNSHGQRKYNLDHTLDPVVEFDSPVVTTTNYTSYVIEHVLQTQVDFSNTVDAAQKCIILVPSSETTLITNLDTALNSWLASAGAPSLL